MSPTATTVPSFTGRTKSDSRNRPPHPSNPNKPKPKSKAGAPLDFIDTLDTIGGFHHDGPFDAASSHRNHVRSKNPSRQAPMAAFDPSALVLPPSAPRPTPQDAHTYPPAPPVCDDNGPMAVSMGYPAGMIASDPKAARLAEAFGIQGLEAWEDFGSARIQPEDHARSPRHHSQRRIERDAKAASVWDMEATLKSGKPVPSSTPPMPPLPSFTNRSPEQAYSSNGTHIKRSKSLMQRIKKGVRSPPPVPSNHPDYFLPFEAGSEDVQHDPSSDVVAPQPGMTRKASLLGKFGIGRKQSMSNTAAQSPPMPGHPPPRTLSPISDPHT